MCCETKSHNKHGHGGSCGCGCGGHSLGGPMFWSRKKRIRMVENSIGCLQSQLKDLEEVLKEMKAKSA